MIRKLRRLLRGVEGQDLIEYGLLAAFVSVAAVVTVQAVGPIVVNLYDSVLTAMSP